MCATKRERERERENALKETNREAETRVRVQLNEGGAGGQAGQCGANCAGLAGTELAVRALACGAAYRKGAQATFERPSPALLAQLLVGVVLGPLFVGAACVLVYIFLFWALILVVDVLPHAVHVAVGYEENDALDARA